MTLQIYKCRRGLSVRKQWRWRVVARNGRVIANRGEGYNNRADLLRAVDLVRFTLVSMKPADSSPQTSRYTATSTASAKASGVRWSADSSF